jgi:hypothetical protein
MPASAPPAVTDEIAARRRARLFDLSLVLGLVLLLLGVSASAPRWSRFLRQPVQGAPDEPIDDDAAPASPTPAGEVQRTINVKLFFPAQDGGGLMLEERTVPFSNDLARQVEALVEALLAGSQQQHAPALPAGTRVLSTFVTGAGVAYVSLSKEARAAESGGSRAELLSVYALVDSITANFPALNRVQVLIDDQPAPTLLGHVDLSRPLPPDMSLLAAAEVRPAEPASPAPVAGADGAAR